MNWIVLFLSCALTVFVISSSASYLTMTYVPILGLPVLKVTEQKRLKKVQSLTQNCEGCILDFLGLVDQQKGYKAEEHKVTTDDGYTLILHRLNNESSPILMRNKPIVYLQHGLVGSSDMWINLGPKISLAYQLADQGFDVWLGNVRGNTYSRYHELYTPENNSSQFFNFTFEEMAVYDVPAFIDYILDKTEKSQLTYIGHSMGTVLSYVLLSLKPQYNYKIDQLISLAPIAFFTETYYTAENVASYLKFVAEVFSADEILPHTDIYLQYSNDFCRKSTWSPTCLKIFDFIMDINELDMENIPKILRHFPAGTSYRTLVHLQQLIKSKKFARFDYGCRDPLDEQNCRNMQIYRRVTPPEYDLSLINTFVSIYYAENDIVAHPNDVTILGSKLKLLVNTQESEHEKFNHNDFLWSNLAKEKVYDRLITNLKNPTLTNQIPAKRETKKKLVTTLETSNAMDVINWRNSTRRPSQDDKLVDNPQISLSWNNSNLFSTSSENMEV